MTTHGVLKLLRIDTNRTRPVTEEEITASLEEGVDAGVIEEHEHQMVQNVFHLDDRPLTSLMVPRTDIDWLDASSTVAQCLRQAGKGGERGTHSWYPVCRGWLDDVRGPDQRGAAAAARTGRARLDRGPCRARHLRARNPDGHGAAGAVSRQRSGRMVFVVDEYGVVQGLLTPRDLLEAITGELQPGAQIDAWATRRDDGSWLLDGLMPVNELKARLDIRELPEEDKGRFNTLAGLLMSVSGRLPGIARAYRVRGMDIRGGGP